MSTPLIPKSPTFTPNVQAQIDDLRERQYYTVGAERRKFEREIEQVQFRAFMGRREFARGALLGMLQSGMIPAKAKPAEKRKYAKLAFEWADAMLVAEEESAK